MLGSGYDTSTGTFSSDGRVFQVEYAQKATDLGGTALAIKCVDGIVFAAENFPSSQLVVKNTQYKIIPISKTMAAVSAGLMADGRYIATYGQEIASGFMSNYSANATPKFVAERISLLLQQFTQFSSERPIGVSTIIGGLDDNGKPSIYTLDPSGSFFGYKGIAVGKGKATAKTEIEKLPLETLTCEQAVKAAVKILYALPHDEEKTFEVEVGWILLPGPAPGGAAAASSSVSTGVGASIPGGVKFEHIPLALLAQAEAEAKEALKEEEDDEED